MNSGISWRARVLPYLKFSELVAESMDLSEPWDHESNQEFVDRMPAVFGNDKKLSNIVWIKSNVVNSADISDGKSDTVMLLEHPEGTPWLEPEDLSVLEAIKMVKNLDDGHELVAARYNGTVLFIDNTLNHNQLRALFSPAGGEVTDDVDR